MLRCMSPLMALSRLNLPCAPVAAIGDGKWAPVCGSARDYMQKLNEFLADTGAENEGMAIGADGWRQDGLNQHDKMLTALRSIVYWQAVISQLDAVAGRCCSCSVALTGRMPTIDP